MDVLEMHEALRDAPLKLVAARIKRARREIVEDGRPLSHDKLAERVGTSRQHLINLEKGKHRPRPDTLAKIAAATGRDAAWFLDPEVDPSPFPVGEAA